MLERVINGMFHRWNGRAVVGAIVGLSVAVGLAGSGPVAAASGVTKSGSGSQGSLKQGLAFYKGKTLTWITPDAAGGGFDAQARLYAPALARYLHATVNVENRPGGDSVLGQNAVASAPPDGLTFGFLNPTPDAVDTLIHKQGVNFNPSDVQMLGASGASPIVWVAQKSSPITSWSDLLHSATVPRELARTTGTTTTNQVLTDAAFNIKTKLVLGYSTGPLLIQGFQRGDGEITADTLSEIEPLITAGKAQPLALSGPLPAGGTYPASLSKAPTLADLAKRFPPKTKQQRQATTALAALGSVSAQGLFAPTKTPSAEVQALRAAVKSILTDPSLKSKALSEGLTPGYESPAQLHQGYIKVLKVAKPVAPLLANY